MITTVERLQVDAAIIFSDLLPILEPLGFDLEFAAGEGPIIHNPIKDKNDLARLRELDDLSTLEFVFETVRQTKSWTAAASDHWVCRCSVHIGQLCHRRGWLKELSSDQDLMLSRSRRVACVAGLCYREQSRST